jgi:hypothetical protein
MVLAMAMPASASGKGNVLQVGPGREYETIQAAVNAARQGSKILVYPDRYAESVKIKTNNLEILAQSGDVILTPPQAQPAFDIDADHVTVRGFEITGADFEGIRFRGSHNTFADNMLHTFQGPGPTAIVCDDQDGGSDHNIIENNSLSGTDGKGLYYGISLVASSDGVNKGNIIRDNTIVDIDNGGISITNGTGFQISGNRLEHLHLGDCIVVEASNDTSQGGHRIVNNTMVGCAGHGISLSAQPGTLLVHNHVAGNWIEYCGQDCLVLEAGTGAALTHNQVMSNTVSLSMVNGILLSAGQGAAVNENLIGGNRILGNLIDGISLTAGSDHNRILNNGVGENQKVGISVAGDENLIVHNWVRNNEKNVQDTGVGNRWRNNTVGE